MIEPRERSAENPAYGLEYADMRRADHPLTKRHPSREETAGMPILCIPTD